MKNTSMTICDATIHPGETANLALPLPELYSCTSLYMPIRVVHGKEAGPCLLVFAAVKGDELNGLEIINRLMAMDVFKNLNGTLIAVPVLNIFGLMNLSAAMPYEPSLEGCFPGDDQGSYGERLAAVFTREILTKADCCVELRTGSLNHDILPQIYCDLNDTEGRRLARSFGVPVITHVQVDNNPLRQTTANLNIPLLVYQSGEAMRFSESAIGLGQQGLLRVMEAMGMLPEQQSEEDEHFRSVFSRDQDWIRAHVSGVLQSEVELGQMINKGQVIGRIGDPFSAERDQAVKAQIDGIVVGINRHPLIHEGQTIFKVASFIDNDKAESALEAWTEQQADD